MTTDQAVARLEAEAKRLRDQGLLAAAHDYQTKASDLARLAGDAYRLPAARKRRVPQGFGGRK
jgi:hypothetical protein